MIEGVREKDRQTERDRGRRAVWLSQRVRKTSSVFEGSERERKEKSSVVE